MAKVSNKTKGFNSISRDVVFDNEISDRARFLYVFMACKPEGWEFYQDNVAAELGYKKDTLRKYLDELITRGWITEEEQRNSGQFGCLAYTIEIKRRDGNLPFRKNTVSKKNRNGKNPNQRNIYNSSSINTPTKEEIKNNKEIIKTCSNEQAKGEVSFEDFYKLYPNKRSKQAAIKAWNKLSAKDKQKAYDTLPAYISDCALNKRSFQYPATYLNGRTFEDEFGVQRISFYDELLGDSDEKKRFKAYMRKQYPEIENTALPLSYEDYIQLVNEHGVDTVTAMLDKIYGEIYRYRKSDIAHVMRSFMED